MPQKIDKIREIDEKEDAVAVMHVVRQIGALAPRGRVSRNSRTIKRELQRQSYLSFLFREHGRVHAFGRESHVLETHLLPPGVRMDPHVLDFLVKEVQPSAVELSRRLRPVVEHGWMYLTARQYNLVVLARRLAERLHAFDFRHLNWHDVTLIDRLRRIESLFLMLHYAPGTLESIVEAIRIFFRKQHEPEEEAVRTGSLVLEILSPDFALPSLHNCIVGLNIVKYRRMLTLRDLMREGLGEMVDSRGFDCEGQVRSRMEQYIDDALQSMGKVHEQLQEARRMNRYITFDEQGRADTALLRGVYGPTDPRIPVDFDADQGNLVLFLSRLIRSFDRVFSPLLNGTCVLQGDEKAAVFSRSFFEMDFGRLRMVVDRLEKGPFHFADFPLSRYLQIRGERLGTVGNEMEGSQVIAEGVGCLVDIGKTLVKLLGLRSPAGSADDKQPPLQPVVLQGKAFTIPFEGRRLKAHPLLNGKTVLEALAAAVSICFTVGLHFQDDFLFIFSGKEKKLHVDLQTRLKLMENLLDPENFRDLSALYA